MTTRNLNLNEVFVKNLKNTILEHCSKDKIINELTELTDKSMLTQVETKPGCYFILSRPTASDDWIFRNIGTYHKSVRERIRQHCYAPKGTQPHSQKYEVDKSSDEWAVTYRIIEPIELRYTVEEFLIKHFNPVDNQKHNKKNK